LGGADDGLAFFGQQAAGAERLLCHERLLMGSVH
jgi:hypothetical protein